MTINLRSISIKTHGSESRCQAKKDAQPGGKAFERKLVHSVVVPITTYNSFVSLLKSFIANVPNNLMKKMCVNQLWVTSYIRLNSFS